MFSLNSSAAIAEGERERRSLEEATAGHGVLVVVDNIIPPLLI